MVKNLQLGTCAVSELQEKNNPGATGNKNQSGFY